MKARRQTPTDVEVGRRLRLLRLERNISQTELGDRLGVTFQQVQKYERGVNRISAGRLQQVADTFKVPISYFFGPSGSLNQEGQAVFGFLETASSLRLVKAFSRISDREQRAALVALAEAMASRKSAQR